MPEDGKAGVEALDSAVRAGEGGLTDAVSRPVLLGDLAGAGLKLTRTFAFFWKSGLLPSERWTAQIAMQFRFTFFAAK